LAYSERFKELTVGRIFFGVSALFLFLAAIGANLIPNATAWGLCLMALGLMTNGIGTWPWKRTTP